MAQSNALREQPSMDEILASIRRIIDAGETQANASTPKPRDDAQVTVQVTVPPAAANDERADRPRTPKTELPQAPATARVAAPEASPAIAAAVSDYLEKERGKTVAAPVVQAPEVEASLIEAYEPDIAPALDALPEPDISEVEEALRAEFGPVDRNMLSAERRAKYDARFTEADDGAFRQVGSLLRGKVEEVLAAAPASERRANALVSDAVSQSVSHSFSNLSEMFSGKDGGSLEAVVEDMLRPMLQEWLDNNLPSLVERLVRGEIERIARGEPRSA